MVQMVMFLVFPEDIMNVLARTEPDFEILIFLEFYGHFLVKFWPFLGFLAQNQKFYVHKIPKKLKIKNPAL